MPSRIIAHIDMDAFFASIEATKHPEWKNEPIVVCVFSGRTRDSGVVSSASYDARKMGVKAGMPIVSAKQKCSQGHFVPVQHGLYQTISEQVFVKLFPFSDSVEMASIDEAYAEITQKCQNDYELAEKKLREFQQEIKKELNLSCSVGMGPNKLVSKMASDFQKPFGLTIVKPENVQSFLDELPVKMVPGVGPKTEEELESFGIRTIRELRLFSSNELVKKFGVARGNMLFQYSRGIDESPVESERERKQHSRIWTLVNDAHSWMEVKGLVKQNADELWEETAAKGVFFVQIGVIGISSKLSQASKSKTMPLPVMSREQFFQELEALFQQLFETAQLPLRRMGIRVGGFATAPKQRRLRDF